LTTDYTLFYADHKLRLNTNAVPSVFSKLSQFDIITKDHNYVNRRDRSRSPMNVKLSGISRGVQSLNEAVQPHSETALLNSSRLRQCDDLLTDVTNKDLVNKDLIRTGRSRSLTKLEDSCARIDTEVVQQQTSAQLHEEHSYHVIKERSNSVKAKLRNKIKLLQQTLRRKKKKIKTVFQLMITLQNKLLLNEEISNLVIENFSGIAKELFESQIKNSERGPTGRRYSDELKKIALTLHFYSPRAYEYMRSFICLPASSSISNWTSSVKCEPGFFVDVINHIKDRSSEDSSYK